MRRAVYVTAILMIVSLAQIMAVEANPIMFGPQWKIYLPEQPNSKTYQTSTVPIEIHIYTPTDYPKITKIYYILDLNHSSKNNPEKLLTISNPQPTTYYKKPIISYSATGTSNNLSNGTHTIDVYAVNTKGETIKSGTRYFLINVTSINPTPTIPESSWLAIIPLMATILSIAILVKYQKNTKVSR